MDGIQIQSLHVAEQFVKCPSKEQKCDLVREYLKNVCGVPLSKWPTGKLLWYVVPFSTGVLKVVPQYPQWELRLHPDGIQQRWEVKSKSGLKPSFIF